MGTLDVFPLPVGVSTHDSGNLGQRVLHPSPSEPSSPMSSASVTPTSLHSSPSFKPPLGFDANTFIPVGVLFPSKQPDGNGEPGGIAEAISLERAGWVRTCASDCNELSQYPPLRIYVLPDDIQRKSLPRSSHSLRRALKTLMSKLDKSPEAWNCQTESSTPGLHGNIDEENESLFYIFNTLESPDPNPDLVSDPWARLAMDELLECDDGARLHGLQTQLYPYQRRAAAAMVQKESAPGESLDPRLQCVYGPTGREYYYDEEKGSIVSEKRMYSNPCGGILAETMGFGKTLICLAVILATKGHFPRIPIEHLENNVPIRGKTGTLLEMAAATAGRTSTPWGLHFERLKYAGDNYDKCVKACEEHRGTYNIVEEPRYGYRGATNKVPVIHIKLSKSSLVIVPPNLVDHWLKEIQKHTLGLNVLVLKGSCDRTPCVDRLLQSDIVLFSKPRFEREIGTFNTSSSPYHSPLQKIHWLRVIVDEGHNFASHSHKSNAMHMLGKLHVERKWIISGTPSRGLYGLEVSLASEETNGNAGVHSDETKAATILKNRKDVANVLDEELKNLDRLRNIVVDFLNQKPWSNSRASDPANWTKYIKPTGPDGKHRMASCLRATLQSLVLRHRVDDINKELILPRLENKVVYLEPTFHDTISLNLFNLYLVVNAVTSERTGEDYMFHPKNRRHLSQLINNVRHAGFWWTGFEREAIQETLKLSKKYLEEKGQQLPDSDMNMLQQAVEIAEQAIECSSWNALSQFDEIGVYISHFPEHGRAFWEIDKSRESREPLLLGITFAREAQKFVANRLCDHDPAEGLPGAGIKARSQRQKDNSPEHHKDTGSAATRKDNDQLSHGGKPPSRRKKNDVKTRLVGLPANSPLGAAKFLGTTSAKLTYLLDKVLEHQASEKIIIFYENNNTAFWLAEGLELLGVEFRIYSATLRADRRSEYLTSFNDSPEIRVLLLELRQASHGLHIACASRVYIVNPIWDPNVESQAIKRAHRISQDKPVYVETLVLKDTLEDKMLQRRKVMSGPEMQHAERDPLDDRTMSYIIQNAGFSPTLQNEQSAPPARLSNPLGFFDRHKLSVPANHPIFAAEGPQATTPKSKRKAEIDMHWVESDVLPPSPLRRTPKKQRPSPANEVVTESGITMIMPRSSTPRRRRSVSTLRGTPSDSG